MLQLCYRVGQGHIPYHIAHLLVTTHLLAMTKPFGNVCPITTGDMLYWFTSYGLCLQFLDIVVTCFLAPIKNNHQRQVWNYNAWHSMCFRPSFKLSCPPTQHGKCFNWLSKGIMFQKLCVTSGDIIQFILSIHKFYKFEFLIFHSHSNYKDDVTMISSTIQTCRNPNFGFATKAKGLQGCKPRESPRVTSHTPGSVGKCEGMNPHTPKATPTLGNGVPVDSQNFKEQFQKSKLNGLWYSLYHWKALRT